MKDSDEVIDRVLTGLRDVSAPVGMEQRVRAAMECRTAERTGWQWRSWSVGMAAVVVLLAAGVVEVKRPRVHNDVVAEAKQTLIVDNPAPIVASESRNTEILRVAQNDLGHRAPRTVDPPAVNDVDMGGIPAPPMPLTEQERLLLQLAHRADATGLTPLNAEARAKQNAAFDAEFQEFFAPPAPTSANTNLTEKEKGETQ